ncbi:N-acetyl-gamma-glutamyl-phosphate reductase [Pandoraea thiooxydans]|uniref:N-acetyl-gamma-glutamyl-phosphate reductase n=1 Tax=Pandoraea thiooxydans TaxID=445709 RepID=A0A0G3EKX0_9BURK|nr:N-acetyl-gamma-glutamyl-phosphate reductase [Pandoraea thiooxydans]AKJ67703.1 N-acetyl-gamma-glutamyl-phosphate reductase [Pandoraea thiooxydans]APR94834.1 N-acetyl-gamma-glutamyl-phosphate reductase [Pandoraea thiooxydans]
MAAKPAIYVDGQHGTTGLQILDLLAQRDEFELISIAESDRRSLEHRRRALNGADVVILCLPDDASREAVSLIENPKVRVIDASTAYRTAPDWVYGFAELTDGQRARIAEAQRVSNPGCYATGAIALLRPLVQRGVVQPDQAMHIVGVSGYTGGGKALIQIHEGEDPEPFALYGTKLAHKHVPEIQMHAQLRRRPIFVPSEGHFPTGMLVIVTLAREALNDDAAAVHGALAEHYRDAAFVSVVPADSREQLLRGDFIRADTLSGTNQLELMSFASPSGDEILLVARLDNLGKGASGAAVQNLNLMLGLDERTGLAGAR